MITKYSILNNNYKTIVNYLIWSFLIIYFLNLLISSFNSGGGWDLNEQVAFGNRIFESGKVYYSCGDSDLFIPSSPYFPGVGYIAFFIRYAGVQNYFIQNKIILTIAVVIGFLLFILIRKVSLKINEETPKYITTFWLALLFYFGFGWYKSYMIEFKPDTILLLIIYSLLLLIPINKTIKFKKLIIILLLLFVSGFFKQSAFIVYFFSICLIFGNQNAHLKFKLFITSLILTLGFVTIKTLSNIENCFLFTIDVMKQHSFVDPRSFIEFIYIGVKDNFIFVILLLSYIIIERKLLSLKNNFGLFFYFSILWICFSTISLSKIGSNAGNFEVGMIIFFPFVIRSLNLILHKNINSNQFKSSILISLIILNALVSINLFSKIIQIKNNLIKETQSVEYLSKVFSGKRVFIDGDNYVIAKQSKLNIIGEFNTMLHFYNMRKYKSPIWEEAVKENYFDLILTSDLPSFSSKESLLANINILKESYILLIDNDMPEILKGKIYIPKQLKHEFPPK